MRILALDISTKSGWALVEGELGKTPKILKSGSAVKSKKTVRDYGTYPYSYLLMAEEMSGKLYGLIEEHKPDVVVIEESNKARARYSQKALEFIHCLLVHKMAKDLGGYRVIYVSSSGWRRACGISMSKEDKKSNATLNKAKRDGVSKADVGIKGKITKKHLSIRKANELFGLDLKMKHNDTAEALLLAVGFLMGAPSCDGIKEFV